MTDDLAIAMIKANPYRFVALPPKGAGVTDTKFSLPMPAQIDRLTVTRVEYTAGSGFHDDPFRRIIELHDGDGCFLRWDPASDTAAVSHIPTERSQAESGKETA